MTTTRIFKNGNSQAVRIPSELAYERADLELEIERIGDEIRIRPARRRLDHLLEKFGRFTADFMLEAACDKAQAVLCVQEETGTHHHIEKAGGRRAYLPGCLT